MPRFQIPLPNIRADAGHRVGGNAVLHTVGRPSLKEADLLSDGAYM
jgi:hypothetical protein